MRHFLYNLGKPEMTRGNARLKAETKDSICCGRDLDPSRASYHLSYWESEVWTTNQVDLHPPAYITSVKHVHAVGLWPQRLRKPGQGPKAEVMLVWAVSPCTSAGTDSFIILQKDVERHERLKKIKREARNTSTYFSLMKTKFKEIKWDTKLLDFIMCSGWLHRLKSIESIWQPLSHN